MVFASDERQCQLLLIESIGRIMAELESILPLDEPAHVAGLWRAVAELAELGRGRVCLAVRLAERRGAESASLAARSQSVMEPDLSYLAATTLEAERATDSGPSAEAPPRRPRGRSRKCPAAPVDAPAASPGLFPEAAPDGLE